MNAPICDGRIVLNVADKRYIASFRIERGVITVTSGSVSKTVEVGDVEDPKSVARTVLRTMVMESKESIAGHEYIFVRARSSMRHSRTRH